MTTSESADVFALRDVRCRACLRYLGMSDRPQNWVWCDVICAQDYVPSANEEVDALVFAVILHGYAIQADVARVWGFTRQWASMVYNSRHL
jgi:hypothetical protein